MCWSTTHANIFFCFSLNDSRYPLNTSGSSGQDPLSIQGPRLLPKEMCWAWNPLLSTCRIQLQNSPIRPKLAYHQWASMPKSLSAQYAQYYSKPSQLNAALLDSSVRGDQNTLRNRMLCTKFLNLTSAQLHDNPFIELLSLRPGSIILELQSLPHHPVSSLAYWSSLEEWVKPI